MITLDHKQWVALQERDAQLFVVAVCDQFLVTRSEMLERPGRPEVLKRMQAAHGYAAGVGFTSTSHIVRLMYLFADAPGLHEDPLVEAYLRKPGEAPEQRLDDVLAVVNRHLKGGD